MNSTLTAPTPSTDGDPTRAEWLAERKTGIGASDAAAACGLDPYRTKLELYLEKRNEIPDKDLSKNAAVRRGILLEPFVIDEYAAITGRRVRHTKRMLRSKAYPFMIAHLDAEVVGERRVLEAKTVGTWVALRDPNWGPPGTDHVPMQYFCQVQHQMEVRCWDIADLAVYGFPDEDELVRIYTIPRDDEFIRMMIDAEAEMWDRIQTGREPMITTPNDALLRFPARADRADRIVQATPEIAQVVGDLQFEQAKAKDLKAKIDTLKAQVMAAIGDGTVLDFGGTELATWRDGARTSIDTKLMRKEVPEIYGRYARRGRSRTLRITGGDDE